MELFSDIFVSTRSLFFLIHILILEAKGRCFGVLGGLVQKFEFQHVVFGIEGCKASSW